jgi:hypothetical protein
MILYYLMYPPKFTNNLIFEYIDTIQRHYGELRNLIELRAIGRDTYQL